MRTLFSCIYVTPTVTASYETALPPLTLLTLQTPKTLDFLKKQGISIIGL